MNIENKLIDLMVKASRNLGKNAAYATKGFETRDQRVRQSK